MCWSVLGNNLRWTQLKETDWINSGGLNKARKVGVTALGSAAVSRGWNASRRHLVGVTGRPNSHQLVLTWPAAHRHSSVLTNILLQLHKARGGWLQGAFLSLPQVKTALNISFTCIKYLVNKHDFSSPTSIPFQGQFGFKAKTNTWGELASMFFCVSHWGIKNLRNSTVELVK